jgi:acetylornithine deacetylase/succinyl-diaminopimelate desuccinylase-like protein
VPPGHDRDLAERRVREVLGDDGFRLEWAEQVAGNASPVESPLMDAIRAWIGEHDPDTAVVPTILTGFSDSRSFRAAFPDVVAYGFFPHKHMTVQETAPLIHSADERIDVRDLGHAARFFRDVSVRLLG